MGIGGVGKSAGGSPELGRRRRKAANGVRSRRPKGAPRGNLRKYFPENSYEHRFPRAADGLAAATTPFRTRATRSLRGADLGHVKSTGRPNVRRATTNLNRNICNYFSFGLEMIPMNMYCKHCHYCCFPLNGLFQNNLLFYTWSDGAFVISTL